jgi:hypothetical protein
MASSSERGESLPWHELPPVPDTARIVFVSGVNGEGEKRKDHVVADVPLKGILPFSGDVTGNITVPVIEREGDLPYSTLANFLREHHITPPADSPVRKLQGIKYELPPQLGTYRVEWDLDREETRRLQKLGESRGAFPIAEVGEETYAWLKQTIQHGARDPLLAVEYGITKNLVQDIESGSCTLFLRTPLIRASGIQPDPEAAGFRTFLAIASPPQTQ